MSANPNQNRSHTLGRVGTDTEYSLILGSGLSVAQTLSQHFTKTYVDHNSVYVDTERPSVCTSITQKHTTHDRLGVAHCAWRPWAPTSGTDKKPLAWPWWSRMSRCAADTHRGGAKTLAQALHTCRRGTLLWAEPAHETRASVKAFADCQCRAIAQ